MSHFFSIIVPVYQAEKTITRCIRSVLDQDNQDFEIILVDDGSSDCSGDLCDSFAKEDTRIKVVHQVNSGVSAARNTGIQLAQGKYLLFLDSDDTLATNALSVFSAATENGTIDVVIGSLSVIENENEVRRIGAVEELHCGNEIWEKICLDFTPYGYAGGKLIRKSLVDINDIRFDVTMHSQEDLDFFLSVYGCSQTFRVLVKCVYCYYYAPSSRKPSVGDFLENQIKLIQTAKERSTITPEAESCVCKRILSLLYTGLYCAVEENHYHQTVEHISNVEGLNKILSASTSKSEHGFVARNFAAGRYDLIKNYFIARNKARDVFRAIKKR